MNSKRFAAFQSGFPIIMTSFVNRIGTIGLSLVPALCLEKHLSANQASLVMGLMKSAIVLGTFSGGWLADHIGTRRGIYLSFLFSGIGLALLPWQNQMIVIGILAMFSQFGQSMFPGLSRVMVSDIVPINEQQESIGWLRTANNFGQIISYGVGWIGIAGVAGLMAFDSFTSFAAIIVGFMIFPAISHHVHPGTSRVSHEETPQSWTPLMATLAAAILFNFLYELFMAGAIIRFKMIYAGAGVSYFSRAMVLNTVLCTLLSIPAARYLTKTRLVLPLSLALVAASCWLGLRGASASHLMAGMFGLTVGEVAFTALSGFLLYKFIPTIKNRGIVFGFVLVAQSLGSIAGAAMAFQLLGN